MDTWQGDVEHEAFACPSADLQAVPSARPHPSLMHVDGEYGSIFVEDGLGAVPMVHVKVEDEYLPTAPHGQITSSTTLQAH